MNLRAIGLLLVASAAVLSPQQATPPRFRVDVDAVRIDVAVTREGRPVGGLAAEDFEVRDNGVPQRVGFVVVERIPVNVVLVLDSSESVAGAGLSALVEASRAVVKALRPIDRAAILTFSHEITERVPLTGDHDHLLAGLNDLSGAGNTSLYDAVYAGLLLEATADSRTLELILSDGRDTSSWLDPPTVLDAALRADVVVYAIMPWAVQVKADRRGRLTEVKDELKPTPFLQDITASTGGRLSTTGQRDLSNRFVDILNEFQSRYLLAYVPVGTNTLGWHDITVRVKRRDVDVRSRRGYWR